MESPQSAPDHSSPTLSLHQLFLSLGVVDRGGLKRHYQLARANSEIEVASRMNGQILSHVSAISAASRSRNDGKFSRRNIRRSFSFQCHLLHTAAYSGKPHLEHSFMPTSIQERLLAAQSVFSPVSSAIAEMACK
jgi:hypothetical protein